MRVNCQSPDGHDEGGKERVFKGMKGIVYAYSCSMSLLIDFVEYVTPADSESSMPSSKEPESSSENIAQRFMTYS